MDNPAPFNYNESMIEADMKGANAVKRWISAVLAALMLLCAFGLAETEWNENDVGFGEFDDGYDGSWVQVDALGIEFCLPDGWSEASTPDGAAFAAAKSTGDATLTLRLAAQSVDDLNAWGAENLGKTQPDTANFYSVLLTGDKSTLNVYLIISGGNVLAFDFTRGSEEALSRQFALQIVGSACELWTDEDVPLEDGDADFGEAFEAELG